MRRGANVQVAYYDQQREQLDPERTVFDTVGDGNDTVTVNGGTRHVHGYLRDFLFPPERARSPVKALSGGERNRLLLARLFTRPANVLVLDEPTNDLDLETLELLEAQLVDWPGTLLLVSHDRRFLDNVVTSTLVFEGDGRVEEYVGGYDDWERYRHRHRRADVAGGGDRHAGRRRVSPPRRSRRHGHRRRDRRRQACTGAGSGTGRAAPQPAAAAAPSCRSRSSASWRRCRPSSRRSKPSARRCARARPAPEFYKEPAEAIRVALARLEAIDPELAAAYDRWNALEARALIARRDLALRCACGRLDSRSDVAAALLLGVAAMRRRSRRSSRRRSSTRHNPAWTTPADAVHHRRPDPLRRHQGPRRLPDHHAGRPHPDRRRGAEHGRRDREVDRARSASSRRTSRSC